MSSKRSPIKSAALFAAILLALFLFLPARAARAEGMPDYVNGTNWMSGLNDDVLVSDLSIPGSHDSGTQQVIWSLGYGECQNEPIGYFDAGDGVTYKGLMACGVRHLDIRLEQNYTLKTLCLAHGISGNYCYRKYSDHHIEYLTIDMAIAWVEDFLQQHPSETIILEFTNETHGSDKPFVYDYFNHLAHKLDSLVWKGDHVPTLGEARGKIVLFSNKVNPQWDYKDIDGKYWAFAVGWTEGDTKAKRAAHARSWLYWDSWSQNKYEELDSADEKFEYVYNTLGRKDGASASFAETALAENAVRGMPTWFVSYASANNGPARTSPSDFAEVVNPGIMNKIAYKGSDAYCGILAMDYVDENLARHVWETNYHRWSPTTYEWSDDNSTCTAKRIKIGEKGVEETVTVKTTVEDVRPTTCTQAGTRRYYAFFHNASWAETQIKYEYAQPLGHEWTFAATTNTDYTCAHVWCKRKGCEYDADKGLYMQLSTPDAQYNGEAHEAEVSCRMPQDMQVLLKHEYFSEDGTKLDGAPVYAGTYKAKLSLEGAQPISIERKYEITPRPVNVVALDQIVTTDKSAIETGVNYAVLLPVEGTQLVDGDVLENVNLIQKDSDEDSGEIEPSSARISRDGVGDVTNSYIIEDNNYVKGTWWMVDQGKLDFTPPTPMLGMLYDGNENKLVDDVNVPEGYKIKYVQDNGNTAPENGWSTDVPTAKDAGIYSVWYRLDRTANDDTLPARIGPLRTFSTISPRYVGLVWSFGSDEVIYDGEPHVPTAKAENLVEGDDLTVEVIAHQTFVMQGENLAATDDGPSKVGYYVAEATKLNGEPTVVSNYRIKRQDSLHNFHILPRPVSIQGAVAKGKVYDGTCDVELDLDNVSFPELVGTDDLKLADCTAAFTDPNAGEGKEVLVKDVALGGKDASEYVFGSDSLTLAATIEPCEAWLNWGITSFWYDGQGHVPVPDVDGLLNDDSCTATMSGEAVEVGTHTATVVGLDNPNYCLPSDVSRDFWIHLSDVDTPYQVALEDGSPELSSENLGTVANELTTDEERGSYMNRTPLMVTLTSKGMDASSVPEADVSSAQELLGAQALKAGQWIDLSLTKLFDTDTTAISKTKTPVQIEVTVPEKLRAAGRTFSLIRCHDGKAEKIAESSDTTFKTETDAFSSYLIAYRDASTPQPKQETKQGSTQSAAQQATRSNLASTGDTANATGLAGFLAVLALAIAASGLALRRKER